jgi:hypothetical protein
MAKAPALPSSSMRRVSGNAPGIDWAANAPAERSFVKNRMLSQREGVVVKHFHHSQRVYA